VAYANTTLGQAKTQLAQLLGDETNVFWTANELGVYITEALRTWGAMSLYWKERGTFSTTANQPFYLLQTQLPTQLAYTVTDQDLVESIQYSLLEPPTGNSWTGTDQFSLLDLTNAIQRRRNKFLVETGAVLSHSNPVITPQVAGRYPIADTIIDVRRVGFQDSTSSTWNTLWREDEWAFGAASAMTWANNAGAPQAYSVAVTPPVTLQIYPPPNNSGTLDLITVDDGAALNPSVGVILGVPDDFAWVVKWGALADLLGADGQARDPERSKYCEARWEEGLELARIYTSIAQLQVNGIPVYVCSLQELDSGNYNWRNAMGQPNLGAMAGQNLLVLAGNGQSGFGLPDGVYGISADVVRKAPIPTADGDFLQVGQEELDSILRYAEHIAAFKMAAYEFTSTFPQYKGFMKAASLVNERLLANAKNFAVLTDRTKLEDSRRPRRQQPEEVTANG